MTRFEVAGSGPLEELLSWFRQHCSVVDVEVARVPDFDVIREVDVEGLVFVNTLWRDEHLEAQADAAAERRDRAALERSML